MKAKKVIFLIMMVVASTMNAGIALHSLISVTEQKIQGNTFKHVITSSCADKDEFYINGHVVTQEKYTKEFERLQRKEWDELALQQENQKRARVQFSESMQVQVTAKLLQKVLTETLDLLRRAGNPALEKFLVFHHATIDSADQLHQLQLFVDQIQGSMKQYIENNDVQNMNIVYSKLEFWPARIEKFYQETVQQAIRQSDDTAMLKELLTMVSEPF